MSFVALAAGFFTVATIAVYLSARLFTLVRSELQNSSGANALYKGSLLWMQEIWDAIVTRMPSGGAKLNFTNAKSGEKKEGGKETWHEVNGSNGHTKDM